MQPTDIFKSQSDNCTTATKALLADRIAKCSCGKEQPSSLGLAFFEFLGAGSKVVHSCKHCGYNDVVHWPINPNTGRAMNLDHDFEPRTPLGHDRFYCGHRGWD